jgi:hypothetical protein
MLRNFTENILFSLPLAALIILNMILSLALVLSFFRMSHMNCLTEKQKKTKKNIGTLSNCFGKANKLSIYQAVDSNER